MMAEVVCIGTHPDDVELTMGGTVAALARAGVAVTIVDLTDGEPTPCGTHETRLAEAARAAAALGVTRRTLTLPNRTLQDTIEARRMLAETLRELRPRVLFAPHPRDAHPDHIAAAAIVTAARFYAKLTKTDMAGEPHYPARIYRSAPVHLRNAFEPSLVADVSATLDAKLAALACYRSQFTDNEKNRDMLVRVERAARGWGEVIGTEAGEPFFADEPLGLRSLRDLV